MDGAREKIVAALVGKAVKQTVAGPSRAVGGLGAVLGANPSVGISARCRSHHSAPLITTILTDKAGAEPAASTPAAALCPKAPAAGIILCIDAPLRRTQFLDCIIPNLNASRV